MMQKQMSLGRKIFLGFLVVILLTGSVAYIGWSSLRTVTDRYSKIDDLDGINTHLLQARRHEKNLIIRSDMKWATEVKNEVGALKSLADKTKAKFKDPADIKSMKGILDAVVSYEKAFAQLVELVAKNDIDKEQKDNLMKAIDEKLAQSGRLVEKHCKGARDKQLNEMQAKVKQANILIIGGIIVAIGLGLFLAFFIARSITRPIARVTKGLSEGVAQITSASGEVSSASQSLAEGASEQASAIEETSSSLEEMSSMTRQNADNANHANSLMGEMKKTVERADASMKQLTMSMKEISGASEETSKIVKTIDEISFQTNLLALNAAVEAARAGEAGAGFAVVAEEVRNLAMRAAEAAKNTSVLIEGTVMKIKEGSGLVEKTNSEFVEVSRSAGKAADLVGEISAASSEQAQGISQISKAIAEMDKVVQQNAANAEQSASASEQMNAQALNMKGVIQELTRLVDGSDDGKAAIGVKTLFSGRKSRPEAKDRKTAGAIAKSTGSRRQVVRHKAGQPRQQVVRPDEVIPMDENDFKDF